jgi:hypothetical protein
MDVGLFLPADSHAELVVHCRDEVAGMRLLVIAASGFFSNVAISLTTITVSQILMLFFMQFIQPTD